MRFISTLTLLLLFAVAGVAQTTCVKTDECFQFTYNTPVYNTNGTVTISWTVKVNCNRDLSHASFGLPAGAKASKYTSSGVKVAKVENSTNNPFYAIKFETGEGVKNGKTATFTYTITAAQFATMTTIRAEAKAATTVGMVSFSTTKITGVNIQGATTTCINQPTSLTAQVTPAGNYMYQWQVATVPNVFTNISGANQAMYTPPTATSGTKYYRVNVSVVDGCSSFTSSAVTYTVHAAPTAAINYNGPYCKSEGIASVSSFSGATGGVYSAPAGLSINPANGDITLAQSTPGTYTVSYTVQNNNGCTYTATDDVTVVGTEGLWTGQYSTDWYTPGNWCSNTVPTPTTNVKVPSNVPNMPTIPQGCVTINNLELQDGTTLTFKNACFEFTGKTTGTGKFITDCSSKLTVSGSGGSAGTIYFQNGGDNLGALTLNRTGGDGSVAVGSPVAICDVLTVTTGTVVTNNQVTIKSTPEKTARVAPLDCNTAAVSGDVIVERYLTARRAWRLLAVPTTGQQTMKEAWQEGALTVLENPHPGYGTHVTGGTFTNGFDQTQTNSIGINLFDPVIGSFSTRRLSSTYLPISSEKGYFLFYRGNRSTSLTTNTPPPTATTLRTKGALITCDQTDYTGTGNCTMFANPYASAIDFTKLTRSNVPAVFYLWDPYLGTSGGYQAFDAENGYVPVPGGGSYGKTPNTVIESGQAFMIMKPAANGSITFHESAKVEGSTNRGFRAAAGVKMGLLLNTIELNKKTNLVDGALTIFGDYATEVDELDVKKLANVDEEIAFEQGSEALTINRRQPVGSADTLFIKTNNLQARSYQLKFEPAQFDPSATAILEDKLLQTATPISLTEATTYEFTVAEGKEAAQANRFMIVLKHAAVVQKGGVRTVVPAIAEAKMMVYPNPVVGSNIKFRVTNLPKGTYALSLVNMLGQNVYAGQISHQGGNLDSKFIAPQLSTGKYHLIIKNNSISISQSLNKN